MNEGQKMVWAAAYAQAYREEKQKMDEALQEYRMSQASKMVRDMESDNWEKHLEQMKLDRQKIMIAAAAAAARTATEMVESLSGSCALLIEKEDSTSNLVVHIRQMNEGA